MSPSEQGASLAKGLEYIASLIVQSQMWENLYARRYESLGTEASYGLLPPSQYKEALEMLYRKILKFQATSYCYFTRHSAFRLGLDTIKWNDWEELLEEIREKERVLAAINSIWKDSKYDEECLAADRRHREAMHRWDAVGTDVAGLRRAIEDAQAEKKRNELLNWLSKVDPSSMYNVARDKHASGTIDWLLKDNAEFSSWKTSPRSFLWLHGKGT
jgi:hypothetical protein